MQVAWVPGSFEMPVVAKAMAKSGSFDAVITVGAVVSMRSLLVPSAAPVSCGVQTQGVSGS